MHSDVFKRRLTFGFSNNFGLSKKFNTKTLDYNAILLFKLICMCCYTLLSDETLFL